MTPNQRSALLALAAEMIRCQGLPPEFVIDWNLPETTPIKTRRIIHEYMQDTHRQAIRWAKRLVEVLNEPL